MECGGDAAVAASEGSEFPRKRFRSSGSSDESINSAETSPKKAKVQIDSSFELSEKVQNNHQNNSTSEDVKTETVPSDKVMNNTKTSDEDVKDTESEKVNLLSTKSEEFFKKSVKQQVEELAMEQGMGTDYRFLKPPGYKYKIGQRAESGDYSVCLGLTKDDITEHKFGGEGTSPYEAIREASKNAREFLTSYNGNFRSPDKNQEVGDFQKPSGDCTLGEEDVDELQDEKVEEVNGTATGQDVVKDSDVDSGESEGEEGEQEQPKWVHSLENFWDKALASKFPTISVTYSDKEPEGEDEVVECSIGKLVVEGTGDTKDIARENAAQYMFSLIENILESEGTETLKKNIIEGEDNEDTENGYSTDNQPPFKDETAVETVEEEDNYEDYDEEYDEDTQPGKTTRGMVLEEEVIDDSSSDESQHVPSPQKHQEPAQSAPGEQLLPGAEYCLALARVDRPDDRPQVLDVPNMARRMKARIAGQLVTSMRDGELSDDEDQEGGRLLDLVQQMLAVSATFSDRHKQKMAELFSRSGLSQARPSLPMGGMPGMMAGMGYAQYQHQMYQQAGYPGMPAGYPATAYPSQKMRLLAAPEPQPEPPKPVQPLKNLCQFPLPGAIEGVGSVTVALEDYKTLQVGTFLNDVIIDFYMKYLQFTKFIEQDKNGVHIFTTFWFSRLTSKPSPMEARKDPVQRRYDRVKRWTRKVNIFEKDFVVVPINENYHWYLCIICYPGMVGCQAVEDSAPCGAPARQRNRRKAKDKIKVLKTKMNAKPRKDESDERDEPLASEDEVEHEDDSTDVELWKSKLTVWEREDALRRQEEERRRIEMEKQRREWEERRRQYEEQQRRLYEEQQRLLEEEELRMALEQEEMGEEEENWEDGEKYDEDGNPVEEKYDEYGELITDRYDEFGDPIEYDETPLQTDMSCENGGFADAAKYKTSTDILSASEVVIPVKARAMAAEWDDWEEEEEEMEEDMPEVVQEEADDMMENFYSSCMVAHTAELCKASVVTSTANQLVTTNTVLTVQTIEESDMDTNNDTAPNFISTMVAHTVVLKKSSVIVETAALTHKIEQDSIAMMNREGEEEDIPQMDGMVDDEGSDEEKAQDAVEETNEGKVKCASEENADQTIEKVCEKVVDKGDSSNNGNHETEQDTGTLEKVDSPKGENGGQDESNMSTDDEITVGKFGGLVGYADTGDDTETETDVEKNDSVSMDVECAEQAEVATENVAEPYDGKEEQSLVDIEGNESEVVEENVNSDVEMEGNSDSSDTEDYEKDIEDKRIESNIDERQSDSEIEELDVMEKENFNEHQDYSEDPSDRSQSESEASDESDYEEDISGDIPVKQPCILVFDSLGGRKDRQARLCATLRDFLALEYAEKYPGQKREFSTRTIPGSAPKVPQQPNLTDCGLYLCHNVETFFKNPIQDYALPIESLKNWFPEAETRMKRSNVAGIIRKLATQQNQDKLEQLQFPDLLFVEPEKVKPAQRNERRNSPGSDGDNVEDEYNSEDDYDEDDEDQDRSARYSSSPTARNKDTRPVKDDRFSSEDDNSDDDRVEDDRKRDSDDHREEESVQGHDERRQKRYRSDDSGSEDDRSNRHYKRRNDRASSSDSGRSDDDFDSSAVYGRPSVRPVQRSENNQNFNSTPMRKLPPGISISRAFESNSRIAPQVSETTSQEYTPKTAEVARRLPPGISISKTLNSLPPGLSINREKITPPAEISTFISKKVVSDCSFDVTIEDVSDYSDENEPFDLDEPAYKRTFLKKTSSVAATFEHEAVTSRLSRLPPGMSISRGAARKVVEDMNESEDGNSEMNDDDRENSYDKFDLDNPDNDMSAESDNDNGMATDLENEDPVVTSASMVAHQASLVSVESCLASMVAHQVSQTQNLEAASEDKVPQVDGANDFDSDDETNESSAPAETLPINQDDTNPPEIANEVPEDKNKPSIHGQDDERSEALEQIATNNEDVNDFNPEVEPSADDVDNIDNHGLEEGEEISPADSELPETHDDIKTGEEFKNDAFDDGSNLQNAEEIEDLDLGDVVNAQEVFMHAQEANLPTEEALDTYNDSEMYEHGAEVLEDSIDNAETEDLEDGAEVLDGSAEIIDDCEEEVDDGAEVIDDGAEVLDDSTEVYEGDDTEVLDNNQEDYDYDEEEGDDMYEEEDTYSYGYNQPPVKRARMSSDTEVVLDSGDEDDTPAPFHPATKPIAIQQTNSSLHSQIVAQQQAMMMAQTQFRSSHQQTMMMAQQQSRALPTGLSMSHQPQVPQQQQAGRKRKLESAALCIKDGQVYFKPFTQLPETLLNRKPAKIFPENQNSHRPNPHYLNPSKPILQNINPYKPSHVPGPSPYQPALGVHHMTSQVYPQLASKQPSQPAGSGLQQRIRQLPPGIVVQRSVVREESRDSVEDEDEYHSDDPEEVIDGQEVEEDLDIIEENANKDVYSEEEEEDDSCDEVHEENEQVDIFENEDSKDGNSEHQEEILETESNEENKVSSSAGVDVEFEEASIDEEACEENDKVDADIEKKPAEETSEKQSYMMEAEEVANCDESQKDKDGEPEAASSAE